MQNLSRRIEDVQSPVIPVVAGWIRETPGTVSLGQGVVSYSPPPQVAERLQGFLREPELNKYQLVDGLPELKDVLVKKLAADNDVRSMDGRALVVTAGANMAFLNALLAIADPGDEVILQTPFYFNHEMAITSANCRPVLAPTDERFHPSVDEIAARLTPRTRAVVTVSPNNPTGAVYPESLLREINALCGERGIFHIHDEAYEYFTWGAASAFSPASIPGAEEHTISLFSLSKSYGFASWRIGYMLIPEALLPAVKKIQDTVVICPPVVSQYAAVGALAAGRDFISAQRPQLESVRRIVLDRLAGAPGIVSPPRSEGAFYVFFEVDTPQSSVALAERLVRERRVAVIPGEAFGIDDRCCLRVSYGALALDSAAEGVDRLVAGLDGCL
jgi:aspartate/methionine/tyrosine aminotransferase